MSRILIVDDEKSICQVLEITFCKEGHVVETATSGQSAKKKIESQVYDVIIADIRMPDLDGDVVLGRLVEMDPFVVVVMISSIDEIDTVRRALRAGAYDYLVKPVEPEELPLGVERARRWRPAAPVEEHRHPRPREDQVGRPADAPPPAAVNVGDPYGRRLADELGGA